MVQQEVIQQGGGNNFSHLIKAIHKQKHLACDKFCACRYLLLNGCYSQQLACSLEAPFADVMKLSTDFEADIRKHL